MNANLEAALIAIAYAALVGAGTIAIRTAMRTQQHSDNLDEHERRIGSLEVQGGDTNRLLREQHGVLQKILGLIEGMTKK